MSEPWDVGFVYIGQNWRELQMLSIGILYIYPCSVIHAMT